MSEIVISVLIPLVSALVGGLAGAYVGCRGALRVQRQEDESRCKAAGKALLAEIIRNHRALEYVGEHRPAGFIQSVPEAELPMLARLLDWKELRIVLEPYLLAAEPPLGFSIADELRNRILAYKFAGNHRNAQEVLKKCQEELAKVRERLAEAAEVLRSRVLTNAESRDFASLSINVATLDKGPTLPDPR
jgi:hypothetical protein